VEVVLERRELIESPSLTLAAVRCPGGATWSPEEPVGVPAVVLVRRGVFTRRVNGVAAVADTTTGYVQRPGEAQQVTHPAGGDVCTAIGVAADVADRLAAGGPLTVPPAADLAHRRLLAGSRAGHAHLPDLAAEVLAALLPGARPAPRPAHARVDEVRAALHTDPDLALDDLASVAGWSGWYLSRTFRQVTGLTISAYRRRLRVRAALDALAGGDPLALVAAGTGFADQAHMTRALRREIGTSPAAARRLLSA
jgi:AraC-like DNA-binding protein